MSDPLGFVRTFARKMAQESARFALTSGMPHRMDIYGKPPRVASWSADADGLAPRHVVALMKRTDRDKDWPFVDSLGAQMHDRGEPEAVLHLQSPEWLQRAWNSIPEDERRHLIRRRPLLACVESPRLKRLLLLERLLWKAVNAGRHAAYYACWREFSRRASPIRSALAVRPFASQHAALLALCRAHALEPDPIGRLGRAEILDRARREVVAEGAATDEELASIEPPAEEMLP